MPSCSLKIGKRHLDLLKEIFPSSMQSSVISKESKSADMLSALLTLWAVNSVFHSQRYKTISILKQAQLVFRASWWLPEDQSAAS